MFCTKCGNNNPEGAFCCTNCGAPLSQVSFQSDTQQPVNQVPPVYYDQAPQDNVCQVPDPPVYNATPVTTEPEYPVAGLGVASMIIGIISLAIFCLFPLTITSSIAGLILGSIAANKAKDAGLKNGKATTGVICSAIALGLAILTTILYVVGVVAMIGY